MDDPQPPQRQGGGLVMLLLLVLVVALLVGWAYLRNPPGTSAGTSAPTPKAGSVP